MASEAACWTSHLAAAARAAAAVLSAAAPAAWPPAPGPGELAVLWPLPRLSATPRAAAASTTAARTSTVTTRQRGLAAPGGRCRCHHSRMVVASTAPQDGGLLAAVGG